MEEFIYSEVLSSRCLLMSKAAASLTGSFIMQWMLIKLGLTSACAAQRRNGGEKKGKQKISCEEDQVSPLSDHDSSSPELSAEGLAEDPLSLEVFDYTGIYSRKAHLMFTLRGLLQWYRR